MDGSRWRTCTCEYITDHGEIEHAHIKRLRLGECICRKCILKILRISKYFISQTT